MEEALKKFIIEANVLARRINTIYIWDILIQTEEAVKTLAGSILTTKSVELKTEYITTRKSIVKLNGFPLYISVDYLGVLFT